MARQAIARFTTFFQLFIALGAQGYDPEASITGLYTGPYFDPLAERNFTAHLEDQAVLPCTVRQLGDKSVSWVRMRDADILTVDRYTFVGDERFESHYSAPQETWNLVIKYVQERDEGLYECQVSTEPKMSQFFSLRVVVPKVSILPPGDRFIKAGSKVRIDCQITDVVQLPDYIFWYHEDKRVMDHLDPNIVVSVKKTGPESITSTLVIHKVPPERSGNYTCMPSNLHTASVILHVLNEKHPAAMQGDRTGSSNKVEIQLHVICLMVLLVVLHSAFCYTCNNCNGDVSRIEGSKRKRRTFPSRPFYKGGSSDFPLLTVSLPAHGDITISEDKCIFKKFLKSKDTLCRKDGVSLESPAESSFFGLQKSGASVKKFRDAENTLQQILKSLRFGTKDFPSKILDDDPGEGNQYNSSFSVVGITPEGGEVIIYLLSGKYQEIPLHLKPTTTVPGGPYVAVEQKSRINEQSQDKHLGKEKIQLKEGDLQGHKMGSTCCSCCCRGFIIPARAYNRYFPKTIRSHTTR